MRTDLRLPLGAGLAAVVCLWAAAGQQPKDPEPENASQGAYTFDISGTDMDSLYPGAVKRTRVTVRNPYSFSIRIRSLEARVASTSSRRCRPGRTNLVIGPYRGVLPLVVPARERTTAGEFEVTMPDTVGDACQKATFRLVFTAKASKVER
ncbi:hypothetical protein [Actinoplanes derwentensis]|uniref:Uncharacterized protein n=1 Tax=Actinoplanes derwentensis TaxID=113562 RepID=A0A1H2D1Y1_9ACTN|nr:hypothetical protein [Actinoplanes derwentensis]GID86833.1 hypothetical protein Ade03nite_57570 [Actinoplanes derwentensis]SDT76733.1 hypothetical protein SAMN04489716_7715 [Actinoplanes derwentensis]